METQTLSINDVVISYGAEPIVKHVSLSIAKGKISVLIGANACGKSTLLKSMARIMKPQSGNITLGGKALDLFPTKMLAQSIGLLPQSPIAPEGIKVGDLIGRGRFPHRGFFKGWTKKDTNAVSEAIDAMNLADVADCCIDELSGGQRQRVWIAMALAQQTDILLLDEPTTFLDISHQVEILDMLTELNCKKGTTIVMVLHEINLAVRYADYLFAMRAGELIATGAPREIINPKLMKDIFNLDSVIISDPISQAPMVCPKSRFGR